MIAEGIGERETRPVNAPGSGVRVGGVQARVPWSATTHSRRLEVSKRSNIHRRAFVARKSHRSRGDLTIPSSFWEPVHTAHCTGVSGGQTVGPDGRWIFRSGTGGTRGEATGRGCVRARSTGAGCGRLRSGRSVAPLPDPVLGHTDVPGEYPGPRSPEARHAAGDRKFHISQTPRTPRSPSPLHQADDNPAPLPQ